MLFTEGVADAIIRKMTGHSSEELERYKHFSPEFQNQTTGLIADRLTKELEGTNWGTGEKTKKPSKTTVRKLLIKKKLMAEPTGLEPATSNVTGQNSGYRISLKYKRNQLL